MERPLGVLQLCARVEKDYLRDVMAPFADPKVGFIPEGIRRGCLQDLTSAYAGRSEVSATKRISIIHDSVLRG